MKENLKIGFIGPGNMGSHMVRRLCENGYDVSICGSGRRDLSSFAERIGAKLLYSPSEIARETDIIFTMIPNGDVLLEVISGEKGLTKQDLTGKILVDMSTVDPESSRKAAERLEQAGGTLLRAPVTGSTHYAENGTLGIMVSGREEDYKTCLPMLKVLGNRQTYMGTGEEARYMKIIINMMLASVLQAYSEALVLGEKLNLPWETMIDLIVDSAAGAPIVGYKAGTYKKRDFTPTSTVYNMHKDMKMAMGLAQNVNANIPASATTMQMYNSLMAMGKKELDNTSILLINEIINGISEKGVKEKEELQ